MNKSLKAIGALIIILSVSVTAYGESATTYRLDSLQAGSQQWAYPVPDYGIPVLSATPEGYEPFHIEHYGRHGSRWLINNSDYTKPYELLTKAKNQGKLTPRGERLMEEIVKIAADSKGRLGELTPLGHRQHRGIASRMIKNFPEIFHDSAYIDAKSTEVIRCVLSMANEVAEFQRQIPSIAVSMDASQTTQNILAYNNCDTVAKRLSANAKHHVREFYETLPKPESFYNKVFNDRQFVTDSIGEEEIFDGIFYLAVNVQSHDDYPYFYDIFTEDELYNGWLSRNANWYISSGNTPLTCNRVPYNQRVLLKNIIESADTTINSKRTGANLRFGHESILLPLSVLMELNNAAYETDDLTSLADNWRAYEIFPMGSNIQIVFYRPLDWNQRVLTEDDVLVKILLNEAEATLPLVPVEGNYYRWADVKGFWNKKLNDFSTLFTE